MGGRRFGCGSALGFFEWLRRGAAFVMTSAGGGISQSSWMGMGIDYDLGYAIDVENYM